MSLTGATGARTPCSAPLSLPSPTSSTQPPQFGICLSFPNQFHCLHQFLFVCLCFSRILTAIIWHHSQLLFLFSCLCLLTILATIIWHRSQLSLILILVNTLISLDSSNFDQVGRSHCNLVPICWTQVGARVNIKVFIVSHQIHSIALLQVQCMVSLPCMDSPHASGLTNYGIYQQQIIMKLWQIP